MSRLLDTTVCPDCRAPLDPGATCTGCGLRLTGPTALELQGVLRHADSLVERLRSVVAPVATAGPVAPPVPGAAGAVLPPGAGRPAPPVPSRRRLGSGSVPVVLLSLGGLCLLVAAVVFVAVTWSLLGQAGRTLVLAGVTLVVAVCAEVVTRRGLRVAAETLAVVVPGLLALDLLGAWWSGLAGSDALDARGATTVIGASVTALALVTAGRARRSPVGELVGAQVVAVLAVALVLLAQVWSRTDRPLAAFLAVPVVALLAVGCAGRLRVAAPGLTGLGVLTWLVLLGTGLARLDERVPAGQWWSHGRGWPLLAAGVLAAVLVHASFSNPLPTRLPTRLEGHLRQVAGVARVAPVVRSVAAGAALLAWAALLTGPLAPVGPTRAILLVSGAVVVLGLVAALAPLTWARGGAPLAAAGAAGLGLWLLSAPWDRWERTTSLAGAGARPEDLTSVGGPALPLVALAVVTALLGCTRVLPAAARPDLRRAVALLAPTLVGLATVSALLGDRVAVGGVVVVGVVTALTAGGAAWAARDHRVPALVGALSAAYAAGVVLAVAGPHPLLLGAGATVLALPTAAASLERRRRGEATTAGVLAAVATLLGGLATAGWLDLVGVLAQSEPALLAAYAGLVGVLAAPLARVAATRVAVELAAVVLALAAAAGTPGAATLAAVLTVTGSAVCLAAVTTRDRPFLGWVGAVVLATATGLRVLADVRAPEVWTLPAAALLVAAGLWRLRRDPSVGSLDVLGSGVGLALLPSLLLALDEPISLRGVLVGVAGLLALALGVHRRLAAPFALGALTVGLLALRHLGPYAEAVPRWVVLAGVGVVLLGVGVTWESRRRDLDRAGRYLVGLR